MKTIIEKSTVSQAYVKPVVVFAFLLGLCLAGISASAEVIRDDFVGHTPGTNLYGTVTPTGGKTWVGDAGYYVFGAGSYQSVAIGSAGAYVTFANNAITRVQADMQISTTAANWLLVGMSNNAQTYLFPSLPGGITISLETNGSAVLNAFGHSVGTWAYAADYGYVAGAFNTYALEYNAVANTVSMWLNGTKWVNDAVMVETPLTITQAGFYNSVANIANYNLNVPVYTNFAVLTGQNVPEPATLSLLAGGVLVGVWRKRK